MKRKSQTGPDFPTKRRTYNCLQIDNDAWVSFHQSSVRSLASANYDAAIDSAAQALNLLDALKAKVLNAYSAAYAMKGKFDKALEAAEKMIEYTPLSAAGYLRAGKTLVLQGKHKRAIQVYTQGAEKASIEDELYGILEHNKAASEAQLDKRVDFLAKLPVDLAHFVVNQLGCPDRMTCMDVSRKWRCVVADCAPAWKRLSLIGHQGSTIFRFIPLVGKHIHILRLDHATADQTQKIMGPIFHGQLGNIQDLEVLNWCLGQDMLLMVVARLGNSLTKLKVRNTINNQALVLQSILLACPRLQTLAYQFTGDMVLNEGNTMVPLISNLKTLSLNAKSIPIPVLEATLQLCPYLQELHVEQCAGIGLKSIIDHCSRLKILHFNGISLKPYQVVEGLWGMQQLNILNTDMLVPQHVIQLLNRNQSSLREVGLSLPDNDPNVYERWSGLKNIKAENLKTLMYALGPSMEIHTAVAQMIRNCRALETVTFFHLNQVTSNALDDAILGLPKLQSLSLFGVQEIHIPSFEHFLASHASKGKSSSLRTLALYGCDNFTDALLERLTTIETLEHIRIGECKSLTSDGLVKFGIQLRAHNALQSLHLQELRVTDLVLHSLIGTSSLRQLSLSKLTSITGGTIETVIEEVKSLEKVTVVGCPKIELHARDRIKRKLVERERQSR